METILKNVPGALEVWGRRENQEAVVQICVTTKHLRAREPLLELVQSLGITYQDHATWRFSQAYKELLNRHRISFPPPSKQPFSAPTSKPAANAASQRAETQDLHKSARRVPQEEIYDPTDFEEENGAYEHVHSRPHHHQSKTKGKNASIEDQLESVSGSLSLMNDILNNLGPGDKILENELIQSVLPTITSLQENIMRILQGDLGFSEELLARLLSANETIAETLQKYENAKKGIFPQRKSPAAAKPASPAPKAPPKPTLVEEDPFDDFAALAGRKRPNESFGTTRMSSVPGMVDLGSLQNPGPVVNTANPGVMASLHQLYNQQPQQPQQPQMSPLMPQQDLVPNPFLAIAPQPQPQQPLYAQPVSTNPFGSPLYPVAPSAAAAGQAPNPFAPTGPATPHILQPQSPPSGGQPSLI